MMMMVMVMLLLLASLNEYTGGLLHENLGDLNAEKLVELLSGHVGELIHGHHEWHISLFVVTLDLLVICLEHLILLVVFAVRSLNAAVLGYKVQISLDDLLIVHRSE